MFMRLAATGAGALMILTGATSAYAASINFESFFYTGSVKTFDTLSDAQNDVNNTGNYSISTSTNGSNSTLPNARDAYIYADSDTNAFAFGTAWYFTPQDAANPSVSGWGNPSNTNNGFVQLYDLDGSSLSSLAMFWDTSFTQYTVQASGQNAAGTESARFWPAPNPGGASSISGGTFLDYAFDLTASFAAPAVDGEILGILPDAVS